MGMYFFSSVSKNQKGFTLVELLVVITIIGILATLLIANFSSSRARARDARRKADLQSLKTALQLYYNDRQVFPGDSGSEINGCGANGDLPCSWGSSFSGNGEEYIRQIPTDPLNIPGTYVYVYEQTDGGNGFRITGRLENSSDEDSSTSQLRCGVSPVIPNNYVICND